jgi:hypothetical protein
MAFTKKASNNASKSSKVDKSQVKKVKRTYEVPEDFKPFFVEACIRTDDAGLFAPAIKVTAIKGRWENENAKRFDMMGYDPNTAVALVARLAARCFATNEAKRLTPKSAFKIIIRASKKGDNVLSSRVVSIAKLSKSEKTGKTSWKELVDKDDLNRRKIRSVARFLPSVFTRALPIPKGKVAKSDEE